MIFLKLTHNTRSTSLPSAHSNGKNEVVWNSAEEIIKQTKADVLVIFDCCYAGDLELAVRSRLPNRAFEFLAATSSNSTTKKPGPDSFTSALIHSLSDLVKEGSFSTQQLVSRILDAPGFPKDQAPRLHERHHSTRKIFMSALTQESVKGAMEAKAVAESAPKEEPSQDLLLRFGFGFGTINEKLIRETANFLRTAINCNEIQAKTVSWEGIDLPLTSPTGLSFQEILVAQPGLLYFKNKLRQMRNGIDAPEHVPLLKAPKMVVIEAPASPGPSLDGSFVATPDRRLSAEPELGMHQGKRTHDDTPEPHSIYSNKRARLSG